MIKIYRLHCPNARFVMEVNTYSNCIKIAEALYGTVEIDIIDGYVDNEINVINIKVVKTENNYTLH